MLRLILVRWGTLGLWTNGSLENLEKNTINLKDQDNQEEMEHIDGDVIDIDDSLVDIQSVLEEQDGKQTEQEAVALSLLLLGERKGLDTLAQMIDKKQSLLTRLFGEMVGRFGDPSYFMMLQKASTQKGITGMGALIGLGYMGNPRVVPLLSENLVPFFSSFCREGTRSRVIVSRSCFAKCSLFFPTTIST